MELNTCPFCKSDVLTIYGNEKIRCNGCGMLFVKSPDGVDSILDIWQRRESTTDHSRIRVATGSGMIKPPSLTVPESITNLDSASFPEKDALLQMATQSNSDLEDVDFGDVDNMDLL